MIPATADVRSEPATGVPDPDFGMIPQWRTREIRHDRLSELGGRVETATGLTGFTRDETEVTATLTVPAGVESIRAESLVGADVGGSSVRKALGVGFLGETREADRPIIADVRADGPDREPWHMGTNPAAPSLRVSLCRLPKTDVFPIAASIRADGTPDLGLADAAPAA